jgi:hypothetical protein
VIVDHHLGELLGVGIRGAIRGQPRQVELGFVHLRHVLDEVAIAGRHALAGRSDG